MHSNAFGHQMHSNAVFHFDVACGWYCMDVCGCFPCKSTQQTSTKVYVHVYSYKLCLPHHHFVHLEKLGSLSHGVVLSMQTYH